MADLVTVAGGAKPGISTLSPAEHQAAMHALSRLSTGVGASTGVASVLGGSNLTSATQSGGSAKLVTGRGADTFAGGVHQSSAPAFSTLGSDTVVAGSAFGKLDPAAAGQAHSLSGDTINVAGTTAASLKEQTLHAGKAAGQTITLSDKTTVTLTGVHDVTKPSTP
jgi:hypothetical protein